MMRVSVTGLDTWMECRVKWYYGYHLGLQPRREEEDGVSPLISGRAIHFGIEAALGRPEATDPQAVALAAAQLYLEQSGEGADRYMRGVESALLGVPADLWAIRNPQAEHQLELTSGGVVFVGRPDLWYLTDTGIHVVDFKSTSKDEWDRLSIMQTTNLQPQFYAVLLADWLAAQGKAVPPLYTKHIVLSTRGKPAFGSPQLVIPDKLIALRARMDSIATEMVAFIAQQAALDPVARLYLYGRVGFSCKGCDFFAIDEGGLTGADMADIMQSRFDQRSVGNAAHSVHG